MGERGTKTIRWLARATIALVFATGAVLAAPSAAHAEGESTIHALVNQARAAENKGPLRLNSAMNTVAMNWAKQMSANAAMTHNPNYSSQIPSGWSKAAENVAHGYGSPTAVHNGWMGSSGHRANILGDFTDIGIAFYRDAAGKTWAVQVFGKYGASVPPPNPPAPPPPPPPPAPSPSPTPPPPAATRTPAPKPAPKPTTPAAPKPTPKPAPDAPSSAPPSADSPEDAPASIDGSEDSDTPGAAPSSPGSIDGPTATQQAGPIDAELVVVTIGGLALALATVAGVLWWRRSRAGS